MSSQTSLFSQVFFSDPVVLFSFQTRVFCYRHFDENNTSDAELWQYTQSFQGYLVLYSRPLDLDPGSCDLNDTIELTGL